MTSKNPQKPTQPLTLNPSDLFSYSGPLWRIHRVRGANRMAWDGLREYGPLHQFRWEPHPLPVQDHPGVGVSYTATDYETAFAEVFQERRAITLTDHQVLSAWSPSRPLELLDLTGKWALRHGASASLHGAPKNTCRNWAQGIHTAMGSRIDGLYVPSTLTGVPMVVLFSQAASACPPAPVLSRSLTHVAVEALALKAAASLKWPIR